MLKNYTEQTGQEKRIDAAEITKMVQKLPEKEKERFFYMMKGVEIMEEAERSRRNHDLLGA